MTDLLQTIAIALLGCSVIFLALAVRNHTRTINVLLQRMQCRSSSAIICDPARMSCVVAPDGKSIMFYPCGTVSYNPNDIKHRYCTRCHRFMELVEIARQITREAECAKS